jgi:phage baseplate assembly protein W
MASSSILGSGVSFPLGVDRVGSMSLAHGEEDIEQAIGVILSTAPGERPMRPEFGCRVHDFIFDNIDAATIGQMDIAIRDALDRWEPRIIVIDIDYDLTDQAEGRLEVLITYRVRATNNERNLVYPFYVIPAEESE